MSMNVFRRFIVPIPGGNADELNANGVVSLECFHAFLNARSKQDSEDEQKKFYRALCNHLTGVDGRKPFSEPEERAVLGVIRDLDGCLPCFSYFTGFKFRGIGHHEKLGHERRSEERRNSPLPLLVQDKTLSVEEFSASLVR
jgi:hypothetical protein